MMTPFSPLALRLVTGAAALLLGLAAASPALAVHERCDIPRPGVYFKGSVSFGGPVDYETQQSFDEMHLRQRGVNARSVSRSSDGCIAAMVSDGRGGYRTEYYDPETFELKPERPGGALGIDKIFGIK